MNDTCEHVYHHVYKGELQDICLDCGAVLTYYTDENGTMWCRWGNGGS